MEHDENGQELGEGPAPFPSSLCHDCAACRIIRTKASAFIRCSVLTSKYPRQPVLTCSFFRPRSMKEPRACGPK